MFKLAFHVIFGFLTGGVWWVILGIRYITKR